MRCKVDTEQSSHGLQVTTVGVGMYSLNYDSEANDMI